MSAASATEERENEGCDNENVVASSRDTFMILFCRSHDALPEEMLQGFRVDGAPAPRVRNRGTEYVYRWPDTELQLKVLPYLEMLRHIGGTEQFVWWMYEGQVPRRGRKIIARLMETRLVLFFGLTPLIDGDLRVGRFYTRLCRDLDPLFFFETSFYDSKNRAYLNIDRTYDRKANID